jgi:hypothetical protein
LLNRYTVEKPYRGFESLRHRHPFFRKIIAQRDFLASLVLGAFAGQSPAGDCYFRLTPAAPPSLFPKDHRLAGFPAPRLYSARSPGNRLPAIAISGSPLRHRHPFFRKIIAWRDFRRLACARRVRRAIACRRLLFPAHPSGTANFR